MPPWSLPMSVSDYLALLGLATAMSFTPGPNTTLSTALAAQGGLRRALPFCLSVPAGWSVLLLLCSAGLGAVLAADPMLREVLRLAGFAYLLVLAWRLAGVRRLGQAEAKRLDVGFAQGVALQFLNIKAWMLALTVSTGWVLPAGAATSPMLPRLALVLPTLMAFAFASNLAYALVGAGLRGWLAQGRRLQVFNRAMALLLAVTAVWMVRA